MTLILDLTMMDDGQATVTLNGQVLGTFDPQPLLAQRPLGSSDDDGLAYGDSLYTALHGAAWPADWLMAPAPDPAAILAIRSSDPVLQAIPWEWLRIKGRWAITETLFIRLVPMTERMQAQLAANRPDGTQPYRLVVQCCEPLLWKRDGQWQPLDALPASLLITPLAQEVQRAIPAMPVIWHDLAPTVNALLRTIPAHRETLLYHFMGHGDWQDGRPVMLFDDGSGRADPMDMALLSQRLRPQTQLAFLNACHSAEAQGGKASLAFQLCQQGVPVVIGMDGQVEDRHGQHWATDFYPSLLRGSDPLTALWDARLAMQDRERYHPAVWMQPVLYVADGYQWQPSRVTVAAPLPAVRIVPPMINALQVTQRGFIGRRAELIEVADLVARHQVVTVRGAGGMGKTALVAALAQRLAWRFRDGVYAYSFANQSMPQLMTVLQWCAGWLSLNISPTWQEAELSQQIVQHIRPKECLLVVDNYETILWALGRQDEGIEYWEQATTLNSIEQQQVAEQRYTNALAIHEFWQQIANQQIKLIFTTRHSPVRLHDEVCYPPDSQFGQLQGLNEDDGIVLFYQWCQGVSQRNPPPDMRIIKSLLAKLGANPLAIQLTARRWATLHNPQPDEFVTDLHKHLMSAQVGDGSLHQRTLAVNVRLSVESLDLVMQIALFQLALLESSMIWGLNAAALWGLLDGESQAYLYHSAVARLKDLEATSLIQLADTEQDVFSFQPAILQTLRYLRDQPPFQTRLVEPMQQARIRYAEYAQRMALCFHVENTQGKLDTFALYILPDMLEGRQYGSFDIEEQVFTDLQIAQILCHFGFWNDARKILDQALMIAIEYNLRVLQGAIIHTMGSIEFNKGDIEKSGEIYYKSFEILKDIEEFEFYVEAVPDFAISLIYKGRIDEAENICNKALYILKKNDNINGYTIVKNTIALILTIRGNFDRAESIYRESIKVFDEIGNIQWYAKTKLALANMYSLCGDLDQAEPLYLESLYIFEHLGRSFEKATSLSLLGQILVKQGNPAGQSLIEQSDSIFLWLDAENMADKFKLFFNNNPTYILHEQIDIWLASEHDEASFIILLDTICNLIVQPIKFNNQTYRYDLATQLEALANAETLPLEDGLALVQFLQAWLRDDDSRWDSLFPYLSEQSVQMIYKIFLMIQADPDERPEKQIDRQLTVYILDAYQALQEGNIKELVQTATTITELIAYIREKTTEPEWMDAITFLEAVVALLRGQHLEIKQLTPFYKGNIAKVLPISRIGEYIDQWLTYEHNEESFMTLLEALTQSTIVIMKSNDQTTRHNLASQLDNLANTADLPLGDGQPFVQILQAWLQGNTEQVAILFPRLSERSQGELLKIYWTIAIESDDTDEQQFVKILRPFISSAQQALESSDHEKQISIAGVFTQMADEMIESQTENVTWIQTVSFLRAVARLLSGEQPSITQLTPLYQNIIVQLLPRSYIAAYIDQWLANDQDEVSFNVLLEGICKAVVSAIRSNNQIDRNDLATQLEVLATTEHLPWDDGQAFVQILQAWLYGDEDQWQTIYPRLSERSLNAIMQIRQAILVEPDDTLEQRSIKYLEPYLIAAQKALHDDDITQRRLVANNLNALILNIQNHTTEPEWINAVPFLTALTALLNGETPDISQVTLFYQQILTNLQPSIANLVQRWLAGDRNVATFEILIDRLCNVLVAVIKHNDVDIRHYLAAEVEALVNAETLPWDDGLVFVQILQAWLCEDQIQWQALYPLLSERSLRIIDKIHLDIIYNPEDTQEQRVVKQLIPYVTDVKQTLQSGDREQRVKVVATLSGLISNIHAQTDEIDWVNAAHFLSALIALLHDEKPKIKQLTQLYQHIIIYIQPTLKQKRTLIRPRRRGWQPM